LRIGRSTNTRLITLGLALAVAVISAIYGIQNGFSYREIIVGLSGLITAVIVLGGERGIGLGLVLWVLTLALGYRTFEVTKSLRILPAELLLWLLLVCVIVQRHSFQKALTFPWWLWLFVPFWALGWWPLIVGDAPWDEMLNEFRSFLLFIPLLIIVTMVLDNQKYWRWLLLAFFGASSWIAFLGVVEYWYPGINNLFPAFIRAAKPGVTSEGFVRAAFSFWGGPQATFICVLALPFSFVIMTWWPRWHLRAIVLLASGFQILAIYVGGYRSLWALLVIQIIIACVLRLRRHGFAIAALCVVVAAGAYQFVPNTSERAMTGFAALSLQPIDHSAQTRKDRALGAFDEALSSPLGQGWSRAGWVHSDFLQVAVNLGIMPALIFLVGYLVTLQRLLTKARSCLRRREQGDWALSILLAFIAVGAHLAMQGVQVLPQLMLPVWFVWAVSEEWLKQTAEASDFSYSYVPKTLYPAANVQ
jgi:hypothetical protein